MKKFIIFSAALAVLFSCVSCASGRIHEKSYLRAAAVAEGSEKSLTLALFHEDEPVTGRGADLTSAKKNAELTSGKPIFTGYTELIILSGGSCGDTLRRMLNDWKVSPSCMVVYSDSGGELLKERDPEQLRGIAEQAVKQGIAPECDIVTVLGKLSRDRCAETVELSSDGSAGSHMIY